MKWRIFIQQLVSLPHVKIIYWVNLEVILHGLQFMMFINTTDVFICPPILTDAECAEKVPGSDFTPIGTSSLENSSSESHSADFGGIDNGDVGISEMSTLSVPVPKCKNTTLDKASICRLHGTFRSKCGCQAQAKNSMKFHSSDSFDTNNHNENDMTYTSGLSIRGSSFPFTNVQYSNGPRGQGVKRKRFAGRNVSAKNSVEASKVGNLVTQKRLRKPTKRYIEEVSDLMSKNLKGKQKSSSSPKDEHPKVKSRTEHHQMGFRRLKVVSGSLPFNGAGIQTPSEFQASEECSKRHASTSVLPKQFIALSLSLHAHRYTHIYALG